MSWWRSHEVKYFFRYFQRFWHVAQDEGYMQHNAKKSKICLWCRKNAFFLEWTWIPANPPKRQFYRNLQCFVHICNTDFEVQKSKVQSSWRIWKIWSRAKEYRKTNNATCHFGKGCQAYTRSTRVFGFVLFTASAFVKTLFLIMTPGRLNIASNYLDKPTKMAHHGCTKPNL